MAACTINDANMLQEFNKVGLKSYHAYSILDFKQKGTDRSDQTNGSVLYCTMHIIMLLSLQNGSPSGSLGL